MVFNFSIYTNRYVSALNIKNRYENNPLLSVEGSSLSNNQARSCSIREHDSIIYYRSVFKESPVLVRLKLRHDDVFATFSISQLPQNELGAAYGYCVAIINNFFPEAAAIKDEVSELDLTQMTEFVNTFEFMPAKKLFGIGKILINSSATTILYTTGLKRLGSSELAMVVDSEDVEFAIKLINAMGICSITGEWSDIHSSSFEIAESLSGEKLEVSLLSLDALEKYNDYYIARETLGENEERGSFYVPVVLSGKKRSQFERDHFPKEYVKKAQSINMFIRVSAREKAEFEFSSNKFMPLAKEILEGGGTIRVFFTNSKGGSDDPMFFSCSADVFDCQNGYFIGTDLDGKNRCISEKDVYYWKTASFQPLSIPNSVRICASSTR